MLLSLVASSCLVSFDDYPLSAVDAGGAATGGSGGSGGSGVDSSWGTGGVGGVAGAGGAASAGGSAGVGGLDAGDAGEAGGAGGTGGGNCTTEDIPAVADTQICNGQCNGSIVYGSVGALHIGACVVLFRFAISPSQEDAIQSGAGVALAFKTKRVESHGLCSGTCPAAAGTLLARAMRVDWVEGITGTSYSGADWCRRTEGNPGLGWGADGASEPGEDVFEVIGSSQVLGSYAEQSDLLMPLALKPAQAAIQDGLLAIRIEASSGNFMTEAREEGTPSLQLTRCMP